MPKLRNLPSYTEHTNYGNEEYEDYIGVDGSLMAADFNITMPGSNLGTTQIFTAINSKVIQLS